MATDIEPAAAQPDSAAVFACALSLREAVQKSVTADPHLNLSDSYNGMDGFMRELMRVATMFEAWACEHVVFDEMNDVWPYLMENKFGDACLEVLLPGALVQFDDSDCMRVALRLRLPVQVDDNLRLPVDVRAPNPIAGSEFRTFRIQTVRDALEDGDVVPFTTDDDPFDDEFGPPYFALYGVGNDGLLEHIADRKTYSEVLRLTRNLAPEVALPVRPICFSH
jgi:hypothetical protein